MSLEEEPDTVTDRREDPPEPLDRVEDATVITSSARTRRAHDSRAARPLDPIRNRLRHPRLLPAAVALSLLALGALAAHRLGSGLVAWLHGRSEYRVAFDATTLEPPPPLFLKGGGTALLHRIRAASGLEQSLPALDIKPADLARRIALASPWIEAVERVAVVGHPPSLQLRLRYRRPVAVLSTPAGPRPTLLFLDRHGVVLPLDEILVDHTGPLLTLQGWNAPVEPREGLSLAPPGSETERRLQAAMSLAAFVVDKTPGDQPRPKLVTVNLRYGESLLYTQTDQGLWVLWGEAPGQETPGQPTADQKWNQLIDWLDRNPFDAQTMRRDYLIFTASGARLESRAAARRGDSSKSGAGEWDESLSR